MDITRSNILVVTFDTVTELKKQPVKDILKRDLFLCNRLYREGSHLLKREVNKNIYFCFQPKEGLYPVHCTAISSIDRNNRGVVRSSTQLVLGEHNIEDFFLRSVYIDRSYYNTRLNGRVSDTFSSKLRRVMGGVGNPLSIMSLV